MTAPLKDITSPELIQAIVDAYAAPMSQLAVSRLLKCSKRRVGWVLNLLGLVRGGGSSSKPLPPKPPAVDQETVKQILRLYRAGTSYNSCSRLTGIAPTFCARVVAFYEPDLARTLDEQKALQAPQESDPYGGFTLKQLGLKPARYLCTSCGMAIVVARDAGEGKLTCGLCVEYQRRAA